MEDENKKQEMTVDTWNEEQFYEENIIPKIKEISELCKSRKIPCLLHVHYSHDAEGQTGIGTHAACYGRESIQTAKIGACGRILSTSIDELEMFMLAAVAKVGGGDNN